MKLYTTPKAISPARVHFFLLEKGVEIEKVVVDLMKGEHKTPDYRAIAANGRTPALLLDDGSSLCETVAICRYIESLHPEPTLMGRDGLEQARIDMHNRMMEFELMMPMAMAFRHTHPAMEALEDQVPEYGEKQRIAAEKRMKRLDRELAERPYIAGEAFSIADITAWCSIRFFRIAKFAIADEQTNLRAWYDRIAARPAAEQAFAG